MVNLNYYGLKPSGATTFLEFGSINHDKGEKEIYDLRKDQQAYDWYMLGRYANDIYFYEKLLKMDVNQFCEVINFYLNEIHHKNDLRFNFYKIFSLLAINLREQNNVLSFYELGQTLFGCIEGMLFGQKLIQEVTNMPLNLDLKSIDWYGVDISAFFNYLSIKMHPGYNVNTGETFSHLQKSLDVFFAKGVTMLYAVSNAKSIIELINRCQCGFFDYSFALNEDQICYIPTGKQVTYVGLNPFLDLLEKQSFDIYINRNTAKYNPENKRIYVECFYGSKDDSKRFIEMLNNFENALLKKLNGDKVLFESLMGAPKNSEWLELREYKVELGIVKEINTV